MNLLVDSYGGCIQDISVYLHTKDAMEHYKRWLECFVYVPDGTSVAEMFEMAKNINDSKGYCQWFVTEVIT